MLENADGALVYLGIDFIGKAFTYLVLDRSRNYIKKFEPDKLERFDSSRGDAGFDGWYYAAPFPIGIGRVLYKGAKLLISLDDR